MSVSREGVRALRGMCGLDEAACVRVLEAHDGDPVRALTALAAVGAVKDEQLDPDSAAVPDYVFCLAFEREMQALCGIAAGGVEDAIAPAVVEKYRKGDIDWTREEQKGKGLRGHVWAKRRVNRQKAKPVVLRRAPFPRMDLGLDEWTGRDAFPEWGGFRAGEDEYDDRTEEEKGRGVCDVEVPRPEDDEDDARLRKPTAEQVAAYAYLKKHGVEVRDAMLEAYRRQVEALRGRGLDLPDAADVAAVREQLRPMTVRVMSVAKEGMAYVGIFFRWVVDEEHGLGMTVHGSRVVAIGDHDQFADESAAEEDGGEVIG